MRFIERIIVSIVTFGAVGALVACSGVLITPVAHAREDIFTSTTTTATSSSAYTIDQAVLDALLEIKNLQNKVNVPAVILPIARVKPLAWNTYQFDASSTYSSREGMLTYLWNFGDGAASGQEKVQHSYPSGSYTASLQVADTSGIIKEISFPIEVRFWDVHNRILQAVAAGFGAVALGLLVLALVKR